MITFVASCPNFIVLLKKTPHIKRFQSDSRKNSVFQKSSDKNHMSGNFTLSTLNHCSFKIMDISMKYAGAQPGTSQDRRAVLDIGHSNQHFF